MHKTYGPAVCRPGYGRDRQRCGVLACLGGDGVGDGSALIGLIFIVAGCCYAAVVLAMALYIELWRDPDAIFVSANHLGAAPPGRLAACTRQAGQRRRACAGERLMRRADAGDPGRGTAGQRDLAWRLLAMTARRMRPGRRDWGLAMLAELDHITARWDRVRFAFGAARVALIPPHPSRPRGAGPVGLSVRAVIAGAAIHALAPAAGIMVAVLAALPAAAAWALLTTPALAGSRPEMVTRVAVVAQVTAFLALVLATVQAYPQATAGGDHPYALLMVVFDMAAAGFLTLAWRLRAAVRGQWYALAAGLAAAATGAFAIARPSVQGLWAGTLPAEMGGAVALAAVLAAAVAAARERLADGLRTAAWAALLTGSAMPLMIMAATYRVAPSANASLPVNLDAFLHGARTGAAWLASDNLGGSVIALAWAPVAVFVLAAIGAHAGWAIRAALWPPRRPPASRVAP
jgi:hypothetical protein